MTLPPWIVLLLAAALEVGGDAFIRRGLRGSGLLAIIAGWLLLGVYGLLVNAIRWEFSRALGVYMGVFATVSVLTGWLIFKEIIPLTTWLGLALIIAGGLLIQFGPRILR